MTRTALQRSTLPTLLFFSVVAVSCSEQRACEGLCGTAIIHSRVEATTLYPPSFVEATDLEIIAQIYTRLADLDTSLNTAGDDAFLPRLAQTWEFETPTTLRFDLAPDAVWHDGVPVTASDVVFTFETYRDPETNSSSRPLIDRIERVEARDDHTAVFHFSHAYLEQFFDATHYMFIIPRHRLDSIPPAERRDHEVSQTPVGSGPYRLVDWVPNDYLELNAVEGYFEGDPGIARLIWQILSEGNQAIDALAGESIDIMPEIVAPPVHMAVAEIEHVNLYEYRSPFYAYFAMNFADPEDPNQPHPLFGTRELRQAVAMAVDRVAIGTGIIGTFGTVPHSPAPPSVRTNTLDPEQIPFDPDGARRLLDAAGWRDSDGDGVRDRAGRDFAFEVMTPSTSGARRRAAVAMQEQLADVGIQMTIQEVPFNVWVARSETGEFSAHMGTWQVDPSPAAVRGLWTRDAFTGINHTRYYNPRFDDLVERARNEPDPETERTLWQDAYSTFNQDAAAILLYTPNTGAAVHSRFTNVSIRGDQWATTLWQWRIPPENMIARDRVSRR